MNSKSPGIKNFAAKRHMPPEATYKDSLSTRDNYTLSTFRPVSEEENLDQEDSYIISLGVIQDQMNRYHHVRFGQILW